LPARRDASSNFSLKRTNTSTPVAANEHTTLGENLQLELTRIPGEE
jgi:hypothetical protein